MEGTAQSTETRRRTYTHIQIRHTFRSIHLVGYIKRDIKRERNFKYVIYSEIKGDTITIFTTKIQYTEYQFETERNRETKRYCKIIVSIGYLHYTYFVGA